MYRRKTTHLRSICQFHTSTRRVCSSQQSHHRNSPIVHGKCELDSHSDTIVAGANCTVLHFTGKECNVSPFRDDYEPISKVKICTAATAWQSSHTGQTYILVFNEALWMGDSMIHSLINPNQLRHFGLPHVYDLRSFTRRRKFGGSRGGCRRDGWGNTEG